MKRPNGSISNQCGSSLLCILIIDKGKNILYLLWGWYYWLKYKAYRAIDIFWSFLYRARLPHIHNRPIWKCSRSTAATLPLLRAFLCRTSKNIMGIELKGQKKARSIPQKKVNSTEERALMKSIIIFWMMIFIIPWFRIEGQLFWDQGWKPFFYHYEFGNVAHINAKEC